MTLKGHISSVNKSDNRAKSLQEAIDKLISEGVNEGGRNDTMFKIGRVYKNNGVSKDKAIEHAGRNNNEKFIPPLSYAEMKKTIENAYSYEATQATEGYEKSKEKLKSDLLHYRYVSEIERFIDLRNPENLISQNTMKVRFAPFVNSAEVMSVVFAEGFIEEIDGVGYHPGAGATFDYRGRECANRYRPGKLQPKEGFENILPILNHFESLITEKAERDLFMQWLAFIVQRPGEKIKWAPMIKTAEQGTGKSLIGILLKNILGGNNVASITCKAYKNPFNSRWAGRCQLLIVNEARFDAEDYDSLKEHITETDIEVNGKGVAQYETYNGTNFIFFSNAVSPIILPAQDRRIMLMTSTFSKEDQDYYDDLFDCIERYSAEFLHYLKHAVDISLFNPHKRPLKTRAHTEQVNRSKDEQLKAIEELFESNEMPDLVHFEWVKDRLRYQYPRLKTTLMGEAMDNIKAHPFGRIAFMEGQKEVKRVIYVTKNHAHWNLLRNNGTLDPIKSYLMKMDSGFTPTKTQTDDTFEEME